MISELAARFCCSKKLLHTALRQRLYLKSATASFSQSANSTEDENQYDVVIVGGGMVGGAMACALGKSSYMSEKRILLLEGGSAKPTDILTKHPSHHSNRVCAISPGNIEFLESLNVWQKIPRSSPVKKMQVWDACSEAMICFDKDNMSEELCRITENDMIVAAITEVLQTELKERVEVEYNKVIEQCKFPRKHSVEKNYSNKPVTITLKDETEIETKLLIAADGVNSLVVQQSGVGKLKWNYKQSGVVATLKLSEPTDNTMAWQRFLPTGPIALLPLTEDTSSLVWSTSHKQAKELTEMSEEDFVSHINNAFWQDYPRNHNVQQLTDWIRTFLQDQNTVMQFPPTISGVLGPYQSFPLGFSHVNHYARPGLAIIGDASHRIHPLAGQGVNLGFRDVVCLLKVLNNAVYDGEYVGSLSHLLDFESERQMYNFPVAATTDVLNRLFSSQNTALVGLRSFGLMAANAIPQVKDFFMKEAVK